MYMSIKILNHVLLHNTDYKSSKSPIYCVDYLFKPLYEAQLDIIIYKYLKICLNLFILVK